MADSDFIFNSDWNYQKIRVNEPLSQSVPAGGSAAYIYPHLLGKVTSARVWIEGKTGKWFPASNVTLLDHFTNGIDYTGVYYLKNNEIVVTLYNTTGSTATVNFRVRVYLDD